MRLRAEIVHLGRLHIRHDLHARGGVGQVAVVQQQVLRGEAVDTVRVEGRCAPHNSMDLVSLRKEQLRQVAAILSSDASDERYTPLLVSSVIHTCCIGATLTPQTLDSFFFYFADSLYFSLNLTEGCFTTPSSGSCCSALTEQSTVSQRSARTGPLPLTSPRTEVTAPTSPSPKVRRFL